MMCIEIINSYVKPPLMERNVFVSFLIRKTRIHTNQHESRAYTRLLFPLIAGSRGTLLPSQSARAVLFYPLTTRPSRLRGRERPCGSSAISGAKLPPLEVAIHVD